MAKTKLQKPRKIAVNNTNNNSLEDIKKSLDGGLYLHSSPPKVVNNPPGNSKIREFIRAGDVHSLEELLLAGYGPSLINQPSTDRTVRNFLKTVPAYMNKIDLVHDAVDRGNLRDLKALLDRRKLSRSRDSQGMGLLHKAVLNGNKDIVDYLLYEYPESANIVDNGVIEEFRKTNPNGASESKEEEDVQSSAEERPNSNETASTSPNSIAALESSDTPQDIDSSVNFSVVNSRNGSGKTNNKSDNSNKSKLDKAKKSKSSKDYYLYKNANFNPDSEDNSSITGKGAIPKRRGSLSSSHRDSNNSSSRGKGIPLFGGDYIVVHDKLSNNTEIEVVTWSRSGKLSPSPSETNLSERSRIIKNNSKTPFFPLIFTSYSDGSAKAKSPKESRLSSIDGKFTSVRGKRSNHQSSKLKINDLKKGKLTSADTSDVNNSSSSSSTSLNALTRLPPIGSEINESLKKTGEDRPPTPCFIPANVNPSNSLDPNKINSLPEISEQPHKIEKMSTYRPLTIERRESLSSHETIFEENEDKVDDSKEVDENLLTDDTSDTTSTPVDESPEPEHIPSFLDQRTSFTDRIWAKIFSKTKPKSTFKQNEVVPQKKSPRWSKIINTKTIHVTPLETTINATEDVESFDQVLNKTPLAQSSLFTDPNLSNTSSSETSFGDKTNDSNDSNEIKTINRDQELPKSLLKYISKLTNAIMIQSYNDCSKIFSKSIEAHYSKINRYQMIYDHDSDFWANIIVEKTLGEILGYYYGKNLNEKIDTKISNRKVKDSIVNSHDNRKIEKSINKISISSHNKRNKVSKPENKKNKCQHDHKIIKLNKELLVSFILEKTGIEHRKDLINYATDKIISERLLSRPRSSSIGLFI